VQITVRLASDATNLSRCVESRSKNWEADWKKSVRVKAGSGERGRNRKTNFGFHPCQETLKCVKARSEDSRRCRCQCKRKRNSAPPGEV